MIESDDIDIHLGLLKASWFPTICLSNSAKNIFFYVHWPQWYHSPRGWWCLVNHSGNGNVSNEDPQVPQVGFAKEMRSQLLQPMEGRDLKEKRGLSVASRERLRLEMSNWISGEDDDFIGL